MPRPLLIAVIVILLIGLVGCGVSLLNAEEQGDGPDAKEDSARQSDFTDLFALLAPPSAPVRLSGEGVTFSGCAPNVNDDLIFGGPCIIGIPARDALRRRLDLMLGTGSMTMRVSGEASGEPYDSDPQLIGAGSTDGSVVLSRDDSATVRLDCVQVSCTVHANHDPVVH